MLENLRNQLSNPEFYSEKLENTKISNRVLLEKAQQMIDSERPNTFTQDHEVVAYDVAHAIKPDIDQVVELEETHNPLQGAFTIEVDGETRLGGITPSKELTAKKADIERNSQYATKLAAGKHLGGSALQLAESKQKVANMRRAG